MSTYYTEIPSPLGTLLAVGDGQAITGLYMQAQKGARVAEPEWRREDALFTALRDQLGAYFAGTLTRFELPLALNGSGFQRRVWNGLLAIPFGETRSYGKLAGTLGAPKASRAVGMANGRNPIAIVVPCHRVIGADGSLSGYAGGVDRKRWLLAHERQIASRRAMPD